MTDDAHAQLMVTRGPKRRPFQHPSCPSGATIVIIAEHSRPAEGLQSRGIRLATVPKVLVTLLGPKFNSLEAELRAGLSTGGLSGRRRRAPGPSRLREYHNACNFYRPPRKLWTSTGTTA